MPTHSSAGTKRWPHPGPSLLFPVAAVVPLLIVSRLANQSLDSLGLVEAILIFGLVSSAGGWLYQRSRTTRMRRLRRAIRRLGLGDYVGMSSESREREWLAVVTEIDQAALHLAAARSQYEESLAAKELELTRLRGEIGRLSQDNWRLQAETLQQGKSVASLQEFVIAINRMSDPAQVAGQLLTYLDNEVEYTIATVMLVDNESQALAPVAVSNRERGTRLVGKYVKDIQSLQPVHNSSAVGRVMEAGKSLLIVDVEGDRRGLMTRPGIRAELAVPLRVQDKVIGVVHLESTRPNAYTVEQEELLGLLTNATATAIGNIRLIEEEAKVHMLREMDKVKSQLISTVSHELRTPLASIKGYSTSLQRPQGQLDEDTRREFLQIIEEEADRLSEMIENLLDMSKIEAGMLHLHKQPVQLERIVRKVLEGAKRRATQYRFRVRFPLDFPAVAVAPHRIEQVVHNLVENAIKYSPDGGRITISGEVENDQVVIAVADEGIGIASEHLVRIFEPFYQVDSSTTRRVRGSGLGLAICRGFVEAHGGKIWVDSEPNRGSTFRFRLPLLTEDPVSALEAEAVSVSRR